MPYPLIVPPLRQRAGLMSALLVHAKDEKARRFYEHFDFDVSPKDPLHLSILIKEIRRQITDAP